MNNIVYIRNLYVHYYDSNNQKDEIEKFNCFDHQYKWKIQSKIHEGKEKELTFKQILIDHILHINYDREEYEKNPIKRLLHLIFLKNISSSYTIDRLNKEFKKIPTSFANILKQRWISYLSINRTMDSNGFKLPEASYLSSIISCYLKSEKPSKTLISKSILEIIYRNSKIKHHSLVKDKEKDKIFFEYEIYKDSKKLKESPFKVTQRNILNNIFHIEYLKSEEKYLISHKYLVNLLLNYEYDLKSRDFSAIIAKSIWAMKQWKDLKINIENYWVKNYLTNIETLFESKRGTLAIKMLLSKIWKYKYKEKEEIKKLEKEELDNYKNFRRYFLTKIRKNKLIILLLKESNTNDEDKKFLRNFSYFCDFDFESRTPLKKQLLNEVEKLLNKGKISLGKNEQNKVKKEFKIIRKNGESQKFSLLRIPLSNNVVKKIKDQLKQENKLKKHFKNKLSDITTKITIKNLVDVTDNLNSDLLQEFKIQNPKDFHDLKLNKYDEKNNDDQSININKHIYSTPLYRSILGYVSDNKEKTQNDHKEAITIYELYEKIEMEILKKIIKQEKVSDDSNDNQKIRNIFTHREIKNRESIDKIKEWSKSFNNI